MNFTYHVFGLALRSNDAIPGLVPVPDSKAIDVEIHIGIPPRSSAKISAETRTLSYVSSYTDESGEPALRIWKIGDGSLLHIIYSDGVEFWVDRQASNVWAVWPKALSLEDAATYLLGPVLGFLLRLRGVTCLHASAVSLGDRAIALVGAEGAGKSTTAAAFARRGDPVISDDVVALVERGGAFCVLPAYPYLCLWPDAAEEICGPANKLPPLKPNWDKRCLALGEGAFRFEDRSLPLGAIYVLGERGVGPAATMEAIPARTALISLVANSYATNAIDSEMRAGEFALLGRLVSSVPLYLVRPCEDARSLNDLCDLIGSSFKSLDAIHSVRI